MDPDHQEGWRLCRLKLLASKIFAKKAGHCPAFFCSRTCCSTDALIDSVVTAFGNRSSDALYDTQPKRFLDRADLHFFGSSAILIARDYSMGTAIRWGRHIFPLFSAACFWPSA